MFYGTKVRYGTCIFVDFQYITVFKQAKKVRLKYLKIMPRETVFRSLSMLDDPKKQNTHCRKALKHSKKRFIGFV